MLDVNPYIFRQYDIRGVAERDLTPEVVEALGRAFGTMVRERGAKEVLVGRDNRTSSLRLRDDLVRGLVAAGCRVLDLGLVVTPILYFAREHWGIDGGVMITGSHNPPEENGFKLALGAGTIHGEEIQRLRRLMEGGSFALGRGSVEEADAVSPYLKMLKEKIRLGPRPLKVAVDCGNGTAGIFAPRILEGWGCRVIPLYCEPDGTFPHHQPDPVKTANLQDLRRIVLEEGCDLGVGYDGDADRLGVVDEKGEVVWGDRLMCLFWREILPRHPGAPAIVEVKCSQALVEEIRRLGGRPVFYKTGHSLIKAKMRELGAVFTGEMSGHMFFADEYYGFDDAFYATGRLLRILSRAELTLSELMADIPRYYSTAETRIPCPDEVKFSVVARLVEAFKEEYEVVDVDGARVLFAEGWGLVRASNTQPVLVARCEGKTSEALAHICEVMREYLVRVGGVEDFSWEF
ncbi:phosphomannomutase/phosphoglucomutase [Desulfovirgula thermocuniculi]|uniref:phosphomannomutase/phosphoglucomutase n=1 Tax=Desulfovirgula thermocuniculi TaxID=348842 RepID=UPI00041E4ECC|nr:phosphomannomutase/phosphoglucomutase [Desulfovirgula thermocuniculi]